MVKIAKPQLPAMLYEATTVLTDEVSLETCEIKGADLRWRTARAVSLEEVRLERVRLSEAQLERLNGRDIILAGSNLSAARLHELSLQRMAAADCRFTGVDCSNGMFKDITFTGCKLDMANFRYAKIERVRFSYFGRFRTDGLAVSARCYD